MCVTQINFLRPHGEARMTQKWFQLSYISCLSFMVPLAIIIKPESIQEDHSLSPMQSAPEDYIVSLSENGPMHVAPED